MEVAALRVRELIPPFENLVLLFLELLDFGLMGCAYGLKRSPCALKLKGCLLVCTLGGLQRTVCGAMRR